MEQRDFALEPVSLGGGAISEKILGLTSDVVSSVLEPFRLWNDPLLDDGCERGSFW